MSVPQLTTIDQAIVRLKPSGTKRRSRTSRAYARVVEFATQPSAPTLQQLQESAAGCLADYIVAWVETHGGCVDFSATTASIQGVQRG